MPFEDGHPVRAGNPRAAGHTRLPAYLAGKRGVIVATIGRFPLPDDRADGVLDARVDTLYSVRFSSAEVWGEGDGDAICADVFETYLDGDR